jgi:hypothetical protein
MNLEVREADDRVNHDPGHDHEHVGDEHPCDRAKLPGPVGALTLPRPRGSAESFEPVCEAGVGRRLTRCFLAVAARQETLAETGKRLLPLRQVGRVSLEPLGRRLLALLVPPDALLSG